MRRAGLLQLIDVHHARSLGAPAGAFPVEDRQHRAGVTDHVLHLRTRGGGAQGHQHGPAADDGEEGRDGTGRGPRAPQDAIARTDSPPGQGAGQRARAGMQRGGCHRLCAAPVEQHRCVGTGRPLGGPDGRERLAGHRGASTGPLTGADERLHHRQSQVIVWRS